MNKNILNFNNKGEYHGYHEWFINNKLWLKCNYKNGQAVGYVEWYGVEQTLFYIK